MAFVPPDFEIPELLETDRFRIRPLTIHDLVKDYDAVMTSREYLWEQFGQAWGWPKEDLTLEQDLIDLASHQKEAQRRSSFAYAVMRPHERVQLGCLYIFPSHKQGVDATAALWVRASEVARRPGPGAVWDRAALAGRSLAVCSGCLAWSGAAMGSVRRAARRPVTDRRRRMLLSQQAGWTFALCG